MVLGARDALSNSLNHKLKRFVRRSMQRFSPVVELRAGTWSGLGSFEGLTYVYSLGA